MVSPLAERILSPLSAVHAARARQADSPELGRRVKLVKAYQAARFELTYKDLLASPQHAAATRFFLDELYGPGDFVQRDQQFAKIVPTLVRMFPSNVCGTVQLLAELHALSEGLDEQIAQRLQTEAIEPWQYTQAWQNVGQAPCRNRQISLAIEIGQALEGYTRNRWLRNSLRLMRGPAAAAGLGALQHFLEAGFDAFARMNGADHFLATIQQREQALSEALFTTELPPAATDATGKPSTTMPSLLAQWLPPRITS